MDKNGKYLRMSLSLGLFLILFVVFYPSTSLAAVFTSKASGNRSSAGQTTWNEVGVPGMAKINKMILDHQN